MADLASPRLALPYIAAAQAQKHVTHNEALALLDMLVQLRLNGVDVLDPPATPEEGDAYALGAPATGLWAGQDGRIAWFSHGAWRFIAPQAGWIALEISTARLLHYDGAAWAAVAGDGFDPAALDNLPGVGVGASFDAVNRLSVAAPATLLNHVGAGHQLKLNKAALPETASLLFQTGFSGRAEMGLAGEDAFSVKVSPDGASWQTALRAEPATGALETPALRSGRVTLADAAAMLVPLPAPGGCVLIKGALSGHGGLFAYDGASPDLESFVTGVGMDNLGTATLTGTTGSPGQSSLAVAAGVLALENRSGAAQSYGFTFLSGL